MDDHLDVGRVRGRGVVVEHGSVVARREHGCDEMGSGVHVAVGSYLGGGERVLMWSRRLNRWTRKIHSILAKHRSEIDICRQKAQPVYLEK